VHGQEQEHTFGGHRLLLYPLYHPAAALYTPAMLRVLEEDFRRLPALLAQDLEQVVPLRLETVSAVVPASGPVAAPEPAAVQLGLF
jgi:DNA polymerase